MNMQPATVIPFWRRQWPFPVVFVVVFLSALLGIITRHSNSPAVFWLANAILLGLMLRSRTFSSPAGWLGAFAGFITADLVTGSPWEKNLWLTAGNLVGVASAVFLFSRFAGRRLNLQRPDDMLIVIFLTLCASLASGLMGSVINPLIFNGTVGDGFTHWFVAEWFSYLAILPVMLAAPAHWLPRRAWYARGKWAWRQTLPLLSLLFSLGMAMLLGGPGAVAYAVPALLWCALTYSVFQTAILTLFFCVLTLLAIAEGYLDLGIPLDSSQEMTSLRLGILLMALGPLTVSSVMAARNSLQQRLRYLALHDPLTQALNRGGFLQRASEVLQESHHLKPSSLAVLMLDIDHFKRINDTRGHAGGDQVLAVFSATAQQCLRDQDVLGRLGGEEFAVLLPGCEGDQAVMVAERIRAAVASRPVALEGHEPLQVTVSIGVAVSGTGEADLTRLLSAADAALYQAKHAGRNLVALEQVTA